MEYCVKSAEGPLLETMALASIVFTGVMTSVGENGLVHRMLYIEQPVASDTGITFERVMVARSVTTMECLLKMNREDAAFLAHELVSRDLHALNS